MNVKSIAEWEHSAILSTFIKLQFVIKIFVLPILEWPLKTGFTVLYQMISAEAPVLFAKAAEIFISELSLRAWIHTEDNKRRTLQV